MLKKSTKHFLAVSTAFSLMMSASLISSSAVHAAAPVKMKPKTNLALQTNRIEFNNYVAYNAVLMKRIELFVQNHPLSDNNDSNQDILNACIANIQRNEKKMAAYPVKNQELKAIKTSQVKIMNEFLETFTLDLKMATTKDQSELNNLNDSYDKLSHRMDADHHSFDKLGQDYMKKYKIKMDNVSNFVFTEDEGKNISSTTFSHIVEKGETLALISTTYGVTEKDLKKWNKLKNGKVKQGQIIKIQLTDDDPVVKKPIFPTPNQAVDQQIKDAIYADANNLQTENLQQSLDDLDISDDQKAQMKSELQQIFQMYDLTYQITDIKILSETPTTAKVQVTQITKKVNGPAFRDNKAVAIHSLVLDKGKWKFVSTEVESIQYLN